jgi:hypothetical protein
MREGRARKVLYGAEDFDRAQGACISINAVWGNGQ